MKKSILALSIAVMAALNVMAQPTYLSSDFGVAGDSLFYTKVTLSVSQTYYFYQAGTGQTWNYSTFTPTTQFSQSYLSPLTAGYRATFLAECVAGGGTAGACRTDFNNFTNLALPTDQDQTISTYTFTDIIDMDELSATSLETNIVGYTARLNGINVPFTSTLTSPDVVYNFPVAYGSRDSSLSGYVIDLSSQGINLIYHEHSKRVNYDDAWGSITTPYTTYPSTIRERSTVLHTDTLFYNGTVLPVTPTTDVYYYWFASSEIGPVFIAHGTIGAGGQEYYTDIEYLDTVHCLTPVAKENYNPLLPSIGSSGSATVNFTNTSTNANSYSWSFGDPGSGSRNTSTNTNASHSYTATGAYSCELIACNTVCSPERCDTDYFTVNVRDSGQVNATFIAIPSVTCVHDTVAFHNYSTNATSYSWNFGDNTTSTLTSPSHVYTTSGTYNVVLVASGGGLTDTFTRTVTIEAPPAALITPNGPTSFCNGDSVILAASGGTVYHWSTGSVAEQITARVSGTYTVTVQNTCGSAVSAPVTVAVTRPVDTATAAGPTTFCGGDSVLLQANTGTGLTYQWRKNGQIIINATQSTYEANTSGNYTVNVTTNGCRGLSNVIAVTVNPVPNPTISVTGSTVICSGDSLKMTAPLDTANTYQWEQNGSNIPGATNNIYYAKTAGTYTVFASRHGCSATSNGIAVTVNPTPAPGIIITSGNAICQGDSLLLSTQSGAGYSYQWLLSGSPISGATSETYYAKTQGAYRVIVTALGCSGTSASQSVIVHALPTASAGPGANLIGCNSPADTIGGSPSGSGTIGPYTYLWSPASGLSSDTAADPMVSHLGSTQVYTLQVTDGNGCTASSTTTVTVTGSTLTLSLTTTGDSSWCFGTVDSLTMRAVRSGGSGTVTYSWLPSTYLSSATDSVTIAKPTPVGTYLYNVIATDGLGCRAGASFTITVDPLPTANISANDTTVPCSGDSVNFTAGAGAGYSYQWLEGGSSVPGATNINFATASAGSYSVSVTLGACSATATPIPVTVRSLPVASLTTHGSLTFCQGGGAGLVATFGTGYSYVWYVDGQVIPGLTVSSAYVTDSGTYYVQVTSDSGCTAITNSLITTMNPNPADSIAADGPTTFCVGNTVQLMASSGTGYTYQWMNNGSIVGGQTGDTLTVDSSGTYNVIVTALGCPETSLAIPVTVYYYPDDHVTPYSPTTFCGGDSVRLNAVSGTGYSYQWQLGGTPINGAVNGSLTAMDSGLYNVAVTQNGCTDTSVGIYVTVLPLPAAAAYASTPTDSVCPGSSFYVYVVSSPGSTYQWQLNGGNISGATQDTFQASAIGTYDVIVTGGGCTGISNPVSVGNYTVDTPVVTQSGGTLSAPAGLSYQWYNGSTLISGAMQQTYSPPGKGNFSVLVTDSDGCSLTSAPFVYTAIDEVSGFAHVSVYPNPANQSLAVAVNTTTQSYITILVYDIIGNEVSTVFAGKEDSENYVHQASVAGLADGIYLVKISDGTSTIIKRISVQH